MHVVPKAISAPKQKISCLQMSENVIRNALAKRPANTKVLTPKEAIGSYSKPQPAPAPPPPPPPGMEDELLDNACVFRWRYMLQ